MMVGAYRQNIVELTEKQLERMMVQSRETGDKVYVATKLIGMNSGDFDRIGEILTTLLRLQKDALKIL